MTAHFHGWYRHVKTNGRLEQVVFAPACKSSCWLILCSFALVYLYICTAVGVRTSPLIFYIITIVYAYHVICPILIYVYHVICHIHIYVYHVICHIYIYVHHVICHIYDLRGSCDMFYLGIRNLLRIFKSDGNSLFNN